MRFTSLVITSYFSFEVSYQTLHEIDHLRSINLEKQVREVIDKSNDYLRGLLKSLEEEYKEELEKVGK